MILKPDTVLVLDFGGQYCHLIARRIRENNVYSEILPFDISKKEVKELGDRLNIKGIVLSGGPASIYKKDALLISKEIIELPFPVLGLCYGHQLIAHLFGGRVEEAKKREYGRSSVKIHKRKGIFSGLKRKEEVWMSHGDIVLSLPSDFETLAESENCKISAFQHKKKPIFGIQWHPEVTHTESGTKIFKNFIFKICHCQKNWKPVDLIEKFVSEIRQRVGKERAVVALSGGIDSSVATVLASKALGRNLTAVFVNNGLMREDEPRQIRKI